MGTIAPTFVCRPALRLLATRYSLHTTVSLPFRFSPTASPLPTVTELLPTRAGRGRYRAYHATRGSGCVAETFNPDSYDPKISSSELLAYTRLP